MRDLNEDSSGCSWPLYYGSNKTSGNGQCYNGFPQRTMADAYFGYEKDVMRRTMLEHEAVFKNQVYELHRLYRIQRDMMDELKRNDRPSMSVVEDNGHSPMSSRKGRYSHVGPVPSQNGGSLKDVELLEVRPAKVRKKMIDLHLPADEYIDTEETVEFKDNRTGTSSHLPNGDVKAECQGDSLRISSNFRSSNRLADLNEPIKTQETNGFAYGYPNDSCNREFQGQDICDGKKIPSISLTKEVSLNSSTGRQFLSAISLHSDKNGIQKVWPPQSLGAGHFCGTQKSVPPFPQPAMVLGSSQPTQVLFNNSRDVLGFPHSGWRDRSSIDLEADTSSREVIHQNHLESSVASNAHSFQPYNPSGSIGPWNHLHSSRGNPSFGFPQKAASAQIHPFQNFSDALSGNSQKQGFLIERLQSDNNSRFNTGCEDSSWSSQNGYFHGSSSASKENQLNFSATGYNYLNGRRDHSLANVCRDSDGSEMKPVRDVNLNVAVLDGEKEGHPTILPWLNSKLACKTKIADGQRDPKTSGILNSLAMKDDHRIKVQNHVCSESLKSDSCSDNSRTKKISASECAANGKILGQPIFYEPCSYGDQLNAEKGKGHNIRMLDINVPCDTAAPLLDTDWSTEDPTGTKMSAGFRCQIDLNMSVSEDEDCSAPLCPRLDAKVPVIDLEAPAIPDSDDDDACGENSLEKRPEETQKPLEELEKMAADVIVAMSSARQLRDAENGIVTSSSSAEVSENILQWFAEMIHAHGENLDQNIGTFLRSKGTENNGASSSIGEADYFESMTLQLPEVMEDEYMPKPLVPEDLKIEEPSGPASVLGQRPRRGNARRGRQRRDFQRDILPGLTSLSRHEVTEDIQTFDGLMRAMGITWTSSLTRRKTGSTRGRRRLITADPPMRPLTTNPVYYPSPTTQHLNNNNNNNNNNDIEAGLEDRSLTGWGKMTRRPRRQRCPAGNRSHTPFA